MDADEPMRIGQLADAAGVNPRTVRYYERIGVLPPADRTDAGYRQYGSDDLERLRFIKAAQRLGFALDEIREVLALRERGTRPCPYVREVIRREIGAVDDRIRELRRLRGELVELDRLADRLPAAHEGALCALIEHVRARP